AAPVAVAAPPRVKYVSEYSPAPDGVSGAIEHIRHDAEGAKDRHRAAAESQSIAAIRRGEEEAKQVEASARDEIDRILNPPQLINGRLNPLYLNPELQKQRAEEVRRRADEAAKIARSAAQERCSTFQKWSQQREYDLDEIASNLEHQLHDRNLPGTPRLSQLGTGLYVRNYVGASAPSPYPDPHPGVVRIRPTGFTPMPDDESQSDSETKAKQGLLEQGDSPNNTVRGTVIKKD
ncbi:MAG: hypothetical protein ACRD3W_01865, partial [Terriglobales bacterium]